MRPNPNDATSSMSHTPDVEGVGTAAQKANDVDSQSMGAHGVVVAARA